MPRERRPTSAGTQPVCAVADSPCAAIAPVWVTRRRPSLAPYRPNVTNPFGFPSDGVPIAQMPPMLGS